MMSGISFNAAEIILILGIDKYNIIFVSCFFSKTFLFKLLTF